MPGQRRDHRQAQRERGRRDIASPSPGKHGYRRGYRSKESKRHRQKMINLQKRERLREILIQKLKKKFGKGQRENAAITRIINDAVVMLVKRDKVSKSDLSKLERDVYASIKKLVKDARAAKRAKESKVPKLGQSASLPQIKNPHQKMPESKEAEDQLGPLNNSTGLGLFGSSSLNTGRSMQSSMSVGSILSGDDEWAMISRYQKFKYDDEKVALLKKKREKKLQYKRELEKQVSEKRARLKKANDSWNHYTKQNDEAAAEWMKEQHAKAEGIRNEHVRIKRARDKQLDHIRRQREQEKAQKKRYETNLIGQMQNELKKAKVSEVRQRERDKIRMKNFLAGNAEVKKRKEEERLRERENDKRLMKEYAAMLDKQAAERANRFKKINDKQGLFTEQNLKAREKEFERKQKERERADREYREEKEKVERKAREKAERKRRNREESNAFLAKQRKEKEDRRRKEKEFAAALAEKARLKGLENQRKAEEEKEARKRKNLAYKRSLEQQIQTKQRIRMQQHVNAGKSPNLKMDNTEKLMNKQLLNKIERFVIEKGSPGSLVS